MPNVKQLQIHLGKRLKELRRSKGLTIEVLTGLLDMDFSNYVYLEKGGKGAPRLDTLLKVIDFYNIPVDYLFKDYNLSKEKPLKTTALEQKLLKTFRKMKPKDKLLGLHILTNINTKK